jgi:ribosomal protein S18 acetylase RimI-like enzyme
MADESPGPGNIRIIEADTRHAEALAPLFDAYRVFYKQLPDPDGSKRFVLERLQRKEAVVFLAVAPQGDRDEAPLGFTLLYPAFSSVSMKRLWILNDLYVSHDGRRQGIARALVDRAKRLAVETHAKGLILETASDNHPAQALYESFGFVKDTEFFRYSLG